MFDTSIKVLVKLKLYLKIFGNYCLYKYLMAQSNSQSNSNFILKYLETIDTYSSMKRHVECFKRLLMSPSCWDVTSKYLEKNYYVQSYDDTHWSY